MKALLVNVSPALASKLYHGAPYIPVRQIPNLSGQKEVPVYLCENGKVTGSANYVGSKAQKDAFEGSVQDIYGLSVAWNVEDAKRFETPKSPEEFGVKRAPQEWCYLKLK